jgi:peptidoglycan glycosyltransferase
MALVASAVANGGVVMEPRVLDRVTDEDGEVIRTAAARPWRTAVSPAVAATVGDMMRRVVNDANGTGTAAAISGVTVAGKTGTAQHDDAQGNALPPHAWFIAFAPFENPQVAIAVIVESGGVRGGGDEATGGRVAAPIARQMIQTLLGLPPG